MGPLKIMSCSKFIPLTFWVSLPMCLSKYVKKYSIFCFSETVDRDFHDRLDLTLEKEKHGYPIQQPHSWKTNHSERERYL